MNRLDRMSELLAEKNLDALLVTNNSNVQYLSGYSSDGASLLLGTSCERLLLTDFRYAEQAQMDCPSFAIRTFGGAESFNSSVAAVVTEYGWHNLGFAPQQISYAAYEGLHQELGVLPMIPAGELVERLRVVKDQTEQELIREACAATDRVFVTLLTQLRVGMSEREAEWLLLSLIREQGCDSSFDPIVVAGTHGSLPHGMAGNNLIETGDFLTMDFGCKYRGYHADMTRTVCFGSPDEEQRRIYAIVQEAQRRAAAAVRPGITTYEVDACARNYIAEFGFDDKFGHGTGHGVGLDIHEAPTLNPVSHELLQTGQVITIEPGIYVPGWGGVRIEDTVLVTETGGLSMFNSTKELICL